MKVTVEDVSSVKKILHVVIPEDRVVRELDDAYKQLKKTAKIKGFRPGKAPRSALERIYKKDVHNDVTSKLLQESFVEAIKETDLKIVGNPVIDPPELIGKGPYTYDATVEVKPIIGEIDFKGLALKKNLYRVTDEEMDAQLQMLQKNLAQQKPIAEDRGVQKDDFVLIDYEGFQEGKPFAETRKTENFTIKIGDGHITKTFDDQLLGMKPGENREVQVKFPEDYFNDKLADLDITFQVTLHGIREEVLPEIDDEFSKRLGQYETLGDLKQAITNNLNQGYAKRVEQELNEQIFEALIEMSDFEVPESMIDHELEGIIEEAERSFAYHNRSMEDLGLSREILSEKYRETAEKKVRRYLLLDKIIEQENITLSDQDMEEGFSDMARRLNQPVEEIRNYYQRNENKIEYFKHALLEKNAVKLILENSTIEEIAPELERNPETST